VLSFEANAATHFVDRHVFEGRGAAVAFIDSGTSYTYADLARLVNQAGNLLRDRGVGRGDQVMLCLNDGIAFPPLFFGALKIGAVPVPINTLLVAQDYDYLTRDCAPRAAVISASLLHRLPPRFADLVDSSRIFISGGNDNRYVALNPLLAASSNQLEPVSVTPDEVGFWLYSSGSTGGPKGVMHRHRALQHTAELYARSVLGIRQDDVIFSASKMFFAYGLGNSCTFPLDAGATAILTAERPTPELVLSILRRHRVTVFFGFPTLYAAILAAVGDEPLERLPHLRLCVSAGEALPSSVAERWAARFGVNILDGLGSTEALHIFLSNRSDDFRYGTSGKPVEGYEIALRDEAGAEVRANEIGELWCRGPSIAAAYWNKVEATERTFVRGWLRTGDKYLRDDDGYYHYTGRGDDMLKVGGVWVSPHEVESALIAHPAVLEAAVVAHADADALVKPKAFVVLKNPLGASPELAEQLQRFVKESIAPYKHPRWIEFRAELPKTATGKIRRHQLRAESQNG
jgi:benzoate-CoA ligase family protein